MVSRLPAGSIALACAALVASAPLTPSAAAASPVPAALVQPSGAVSAYAGQGEQDLGIRIADGLEPTRVHATIIVSGKPQGTIRVAVNGRTVQEAQAAPTITLDAQVSTADVNASQLRLGLEYIPGTGNVCTGASSSARLSGVSVQVAGAEKPPATVADFFSPAVPAILIPVPKDPAADVSAAILTAAAALAHRYPDAAIAVVPQGDFDARVAKLPVGARIISVTPDPGETRTRLSDTAGHPQLVISGHADGLRSTALSLSSDDTALAGSPAVSGMTASAPAAPGLTQSLKDLGAQNLQLSGYGTPESFIGISQSQFGGPVSSASVHLQGTHTAIPANAQAELSVYWNDYLLSSKTLAGGDSFAVDGTVPAGQIQSRNGLRIRMAALPAGGDCTGPAGTMPMDLTFDTTASSITATRGSSLAPGFSRFPQVLGRSLPVAFADGNTSQANTVNAAALAVSLQHDAAQALDVRVVAPDALKASSESGLVVGATTAVAQELSAPLRLAEFRTITPDTQQYGVGTTAPYGVLEAFEQGGRNLLMLGAWAPAGDTVAGPGLQGSLAGYVQGRAGGWSTLSRNLLVTQPSGAPVLLESNAVVPQAAVADDYRQYAIWALAAAGVLVLAFGARTWVRRQRRRNAKAYVDAEQQAAGTESSDQPHVG